MGKVLPIYLIQRYIVIYNIWNIAGNLEMFLEGMHRERCMHFPLHYSYMFQINLFSHSPI